MFASERSNDEHVETAVGVEYRGFEEEVVHATRA